MKEQECAMTWCDKSADLLLNGQPRCQEDTPVTEILNGKIVWLHPPVMKRKKGSKL